jgi:hypothetical protein
MPVLKRVECELHILNDSYAGLKDITRQVIAKVVKFQQSIIGGDGGVWVQDLTYERATEQYIDQLFQYLCIVSLKVRIFEDTSNPSTWSSVWNETWNKI